MGCVQSKAAAPVPEVLPTSVKVSNSTKTAVAPANPGQPSQIGDPIYLDRADTLAPQDTSTTFQIKSEGVTQLLATTSLQSIVLPRSAYCNLSMHVEHLSALGVLVIKPTAH